jgi:hypothetical protein
MGSIEIAKLAYPRVTEQMESLSQVLESIANQFGNSGILEPVVYWGYPMMMVSFVGLASWRRRVVAESAIAFKSKSHPRALAPCMFFLLAAGYRGVISLAMQHQPILVSPSFWISSVVLTLLATNAGIALTDFGKNKQGLRIIDAYLGSTAVCILSLQTVLRLKLSLAIR